MTRNADHPDYLRPSHLRPSRFWPHHQFQLDREKYACNLRAAPRGSAAGFEGDTNEHLKVLSDDEEATLLVTEAAQNLCVADRPGEIADPLGLGALTVLLKENGSIRGTVARVSLLQTIVVSSELFAQFDASGRPGVWPRMP